MPWRDEFGGQVKTKVTNQRPSFLGIRNRPSDVIAKFVVLGNGSDAMSGTNKFREINLLIKKESERIESSEIMGTLLEKSRETHMYISIN